MKLINPNNEILKFIEHQVKTSGYFKSFTRDRYNLNTNLENKAINETSIICLLMECETKYNINLNDKEIWEIKTPLDTYSAIIKKIKNENRIF